MARCSAPLWAQLLLVSPGQRLPQTAYHYRRASTEAEARELRKEQTFGDVMEISARVLKRAEEYLELLELEGLEGE